MKHDVAAVVLNLSATGIGVIRNLRSKGIEVHAYDIESRYRLGKTRHANCGICPDPEAKPDELRRFLIELGQRFLPDRAVIYACSDDYVRFLSKYRQELNPYYRFLLPEHPIVEAMLDKRLTYEMSQKHGIVCPRTFLFEDADQLREMMTEIPFPCLLKPVHSQAFRNRTALKAVVVETAENLLQQYEKYRQFGLLMVQEMIPGRDDSIFTVHALLDERLNVLGSYTKQKLHQYPPYLGSACFAVSVTDEHLKEHGLSILQALSIKGLSAVEFKLDPRDGKFKLMEINVRSELSNGLAPACGVELACLYYSLTTNQNPEPINHQKDGVYWAYLIRIVLTYLVKRKTGEMTAMHLLRILFAKKVEALFAWDDPMPYIRSWISHVHNYRRIAKTGRNETGRPL